MWGIPAGAWQEPRAAGGRPVNSETLAGAVKEMGNKQELG